MNDETPRTICEKCERRGELVCQDPNPGKNYGPESLQYPPFVFRYYLCRWHRAAWNRHRMRGQKKMKVLAPISDAVLLKQFEPQPTHLK